jgi:hypothetical protein
MEPLTYGDVGERLSHADGLDDDIPLLAAPTLRSCLSQSSDCLSV